MLQESGQMPSWTRQMEHQQAHVAEIERLNALKDAEVIGENLEEILVEDSEPAND
jgi:hypothetical protein